MDRAEQEDAAGLVDSVGGALADQLAFGLNPIAQRIAGKPLLLTFLADEVCAERDVLLTNHNFRRCLLGRLCGLRGLRGWRSARGAGCRFGFRCSAAFGRGGGSRFFGSLVFFSFVDHGRLFFGSLLVTGYGGKPGQRKWNTRKQEGYK